MSKEYIYLASPYSHPDPAVRQWRYEQACKYAARFMQAGNVIFSPIAHSHAVEQYFTDIRGFDFWKAQDEPALFTCTELWVLCLQGWEVSVGVTHEIEAAKSRGILIRYIEVDDSPQPVSVNTEPTNPKDMIATDRAPLDLCPDSLVIATAMAFLEGALKYGRYNWRIAGVRASVYYAALKRHMKSWFNGEDIDPDSGLPHLWKASACIAILIDAGVVNKLTDDRPPRAPIGNMLKQVKSHVVRLRQQLSQHNPKQYTIEDGDKE